MTWLRDYVYIPLGGSRCPPRRQMLNVGATFLLSGLWHGAAWTYVLWGLYHGLLVHAAKRLGPWGATGVPRALGWAATFAVVVFGWIIFRAPDLTLLAAYAGTLFTAGSLTAFSTLTMGKSALLWSFAVLAAEWLQRNRAHGLDLPPRGLLRHRPARWLIYYGLLALLLFCHGEQQAFIYFQF